MKPIAMSAAAKPSVHANGSSLRLRLYVARSTPNSVRAASNLSAALATLDIKIEPPALEEIDVFAQPKRAITDGVIVTPTLIGTHGLKRVVLMGDLADQKLLESTLQSLLN